MANNNRRWGWHPDVQRFRTGLRDTTLMDNFHDAVEEVLARKQSELEGEINILLAELSGEIGEAKKANHKEETEALKQEHQMFVASKVGRGKEKQIATHTANLQQATNTITALANDDCVRITGFSNENLRAAFDQEWERLGREAEALKRGDFQLDTASADAEKKLNEAYDQIVKRLKEKSAQLLKDAKDNIGKPPSEQSSSATTSRASAFADASPEAPSAQNLAAPPSASARQGNGHDITPDDVLKAFEQFSPILGEGLRKIKDDFNGRKVWITFKTDGAHFLCTLAPLNARDNVCATLHMTRATAPSRPWIVWADGGQEHNKQIMVDSDGKLSRKILYDLRKKAGLPTEGILSTIQSAISKSASVVPQHG